MEKILEKLGVFSYLVNWPNADRFVVIVIVAIKSLLLLLFILIFPTNRETPLHYAMLHLRTLNDGVRSTINFLIRKGLSHFF